MEAPFITFNWPLIVVDTSPSPIAISLSPVVALAGTSAPIALTLPKVVILGWEAVCKVPVYWVPSVLNPLNLVSVLSNLLPKLVVTVLEKLASSPRAAANSSNVSNAPGAELTKLLIAVVISAGVAFEASWDSNVDPGLAELAAPSPGRSVPHTTSPLEFIFNTSFVAPASFGNL